MSESFAIATVVGRTPPVSSHLGDRAIVYLDGRMEGFVGGSCSRDIVRRQALSAMRKGEPRLVRIRPDAMRIQEDGDVVTVPMRCVSEGALDVYIEPRLAAPKLVLVGFTPVTRALESIAPAIGFSSAKFAADDELRESGAQAIESLGDYLEALDAQTHARSSAIVASQGRYDEDALETVVRYDFAYIGLVASRKRGASVVGVLESRGVSPERLARVRIPAGLAIGARKPADVAISIFAEIIEQTSAQSAQERADDAPADMGIDPVCGMEVEISASALQVTLADRTYYFCCAGCRSEFAAGR